MNRLMHFSFARSWIVLAVSVVLSMPFASAQQAPLRGAQEAKVRQASAVIPLPKSKSEGLTRASSSHSKDSNTSPSTTSGLLGSFFALTVVLMVFFGFVLMVKRVWPSTSPSKMPREVFEVIACSQVQSKQTWMLMRFGNKLLLVCQQPGQTQVISEITDQAEIQRIVAICEKPHPSEAAFLSFSWQSLLGGQQSATG